MTRKLETALVIDDDDAFRTTLGGALRRRGVRARTAATVEEAHRNLMLTKAMDLSAKRKVPVKLPLDPEDFKAVA